MLTPIAPFLVTGAEFIDLARSAKPAVVRLSIRDASGQEIGSGTGFFVHASGRVVTNFHVVEHAEDVEALMTDGRKIPIGGLLEKDETNDIAILQANLKPLPNEILPLADADKTKIEAGERIFVVGAPQGLAGTLSEGIVSAVRRAEDLDQFDSRKRKGREPLLQITAPISPGSSGSPIINTQGQTIGVAVSHLAGGQSLNFAVPVSVVHRLLAKIPEGATPRPFRGLATGWKLLISAVFFYGLYWGYRRICHTEEQEPLRRASNRC
ncbi:S1C family serine protease [Verrucomicrobiota bacterium sgz303538]